jgi:hypothetical protein
MTLSTYAHVFHELQGAERVGADAQIAAARREPVPVSYLAGGGEQEREPETPANPQALHRTRTDDPFLTMEVLYQLS